MRKAKFYLSAARLEAKGACREAIELFTEVFGTGKVMMTDKNFEIALKHKMQIWWFALEYLDFDEYKPVEGLLDFGDDYEPSARRYWKAIKAKMRADNWPRPASWYEK